MTGRKPTADSTAALEAYAKKRASPITDQQRRKKQLLRLKALNELGEQFKKERTKNLVIQEIDRELERLEDTEIKGPPKIRYK